MLAETKLRAMRVKRQEEGEVVQNVRRVLWNISKKTATIYANKVIKVRCNEVVVAKEDGTANYHFMVSGSNITIYLYDEYHGQEIPFNVEYNNPDFPPKTIIVY